MYYPQALDTQELMKLSNVAEAVRCLNKDGAATNQVLTTFIGPVPNRVRLGIFGSYPTRPYNAEPIRCYRCQKFGHHRDNCSGQERCAICSSRHNTDICVNAYKNGRQTTARCVNCQGSHHAWNRKCPERLRRIQQHAPQQQQRQPYYQYNNNGQASSLHTQGQLNTPRQARQQQGRHPAAQPVRQDRQQSQPSEARHSRTTTLSSGAPQSRTRPAPAPRQRLTAPLPARRTPVAGTQVRQASQNRHSDQDNRTRPPAPQHGGSTLQATTAAPPPQQSAETAPATQQAAVAASLPQAPCNQAPTITAESMKAMLQTLVSSLAQIWEVPSQKRQEDKVDQAIDLAIQHLCPQTPTQVQRPTQESSTQLEPPTRAQQQEQQDINQQEMPQDLDMAVDPICFPLPHNQAHLSTRDPRLPHRNTQAPAP